VVIGIETEDGGVDVALPREDQGFFIDPQRRG